MPIQKGDVNITYANIGKAKKLLNWEPLIKIERGILLFIEWYKNNNISNKNNSSKNSE